MSKRYKMIKAKAAKNFKLEIETKKMRHTVYDLSQQEANNERKRMWHIFRKLGQTASLRVVKVA